MSTREVPIERLLEKEKAGAYGPPSLGAPKVKVIRSRKRGRHSQLKERREKVLKILTNGSKLKRQEIMRRLGIRRKATFYQIARGSLDESGHIFLEHDKKRDLWYLKSGEYRKRTMSQCPEFATLVRAVKDESLDFHIPRREWSDSLLARAVRDPLAEKTLGLEPAEPTFEDQDPESGMTAEETQKYLEREYSDTTSIAGVTVRRRVLPFLKDDKDRERGAIYWHIKPPTRGSDGKIYSQKMKEDIREHDQPRIKMLLDKTGSMSPDHFMYLIPEAFLLCSPELHAQYRTSPDIRAQLNLEYFIGEKSPADITDEELDMVRKAVFGKSKRISIIYTFDVDEAFQWFKRHKSEKGVQDEIRNRFEKKQMDIETGNRLQEALDKQRSSA